MSKYPTMSRAAPTRIIWPKMPVVLRMKKYVLGPSGSIQPKDEGEGEQRIIYGKSLQACVKVNFPTISLPTIQWLELGHLVTLRSE